MGMLDRAKIETALLWVGSRALPDFIVLGTGSATFNSSQSGLVIDADRASVFTEIGSGTDKEILFTSDWGANVLSGLQIREFGVSVGSLGTGIWDREPCTAINFDGTNELQIQITFQTY